MIERFYDLCGKIGNVFISMNNGLANLMKSEPFKNFVQFFANLPDDIHETQLFKRIIMLENMDITYADIEWIQEVIGYKSYDESVQDLQKKGEKTELDCYILSIIKSNNMSPREKAVVLLAHFESIVYQTASYERKNKDKVKKVVSSTACGVHEMEVESYAKIMLAGIVFIVFSNTDNYNIGIDHRIPFRNNILHRGTILYTDTEMKELYEILVYFIAELSRMTSYYYTDRNT